MNPEDGDDCPGLARGVPPLRRYLRARTRRAREAPQGLEQSAQVLEVGGRQLGSIGKPGLGDHTSLNLTV